MNKNATITVRVNSDLKENVDTILKTLGLTASQLINLLYQQISLRNEVPFSLKIPNNITLQAIKETQMRENLEHFDSPESLYKDLGI